jgi:GNAT superfamily N-acetyltransferase
MFRDHHYLSGDINKGSRCWITIWDGQPVGFSANLALPSAYLKNAWRGHRTVILPEYQGMGFGSRMSEAVAEIFLSEGKRYFTKTSHPRLGEYRESSPKWRSTNHNKKLRMDYVNSNDHKFSEKLKDIHKDRVTYNHEYVGENLK